MKFAVLVLCILPVVLGAPDKRFIETIFGGNAFDIGNLKCDLQIMIDTLGNDPTEAACETECHHLLAQGHILNYGCTLICQGFKTLIGHWHIVPATTGSSGSPCQKLPTTTTM